MIKIDGLVKNYGPLRALDGISLHITEGCAVGLLGPNGAGKSTLMNILTCNLRADAGTAEIGGYDLAARPSEAKKLIGYLPELPPLYPELTVTEYLDYVCGLKGVPKEERASERGRVTEKLQLSDMRGRLVRKLSKGYRQRLGIAQALLGNPKVIILDEPSIGLDPRQIIEIREIVLSLKGSSTVLFSTHILSEAEAVCDRVIIMDHGRVAADGSPAAWAGEGRTPETVFLEATGGVVQKFSGGEGQAWA